jgi:hypothetical protein
LLFMVSVEECPFLLIIMVHTNINAFSNECISVVLCG